MLFLSNIFFIHVFAGNKLDLNLFTIKKGDANAQNGNVEANPGDILHLLLSGKNAGDNLTNVKADFSFSSNSVERPTLFVMFSIWSTRLFEFSKALVILFPRFALLAIVNKFKSMDNDFCLGYYFCC